ncbi:hypothetical protein [Syntrophomonas curvata]
MPNQTTNYGFIKPLDNETADIAVINQNMDAIDNRLKVVEDKADAAPGPDTISDDALGARTADPTQVPTGNGPGKLGQWLSWLPNRIRAITGKPNWWDTPVKSLEQMNSELIAHKADTMPHRFTDAGKTYKWGLKTASGVAVLIYEEVV